MAHALRPVDGGGELGYEVGFYFIWIGVGQGIDILIHGALGGVELGSLDGCGKLLLGWLHQGRVEGTAHTQGKGTLGTCRGELLACEIDTLDAA